MIRAIGCCVELPCIAKLDVLKERNFSTVEVIYLAASY
jgi:hypothetical protein